MAIPQTVDLNWGLGGWLVVLMVKVELMGVPGHSEKSMILTLCFSSITLSGIIITTSIASLSVLHQL